MGLENGILSLIMLVLVVGRVFRIVCEVFRFGLLVVIKVISVGCLVWV